MVCTSLAVATRRTRGPQNPTLTLATRLAASSRILCRADGRRRYQILSGESDGDQGSGGGTESYLTAAAADSFAGGGCAGAKGPGVSNFFLKFDSDHPLIEHQASSSERERERELRANGMNVPFVLRGSHDLPQPFATFPGPTLASRAPPFACPHPSFNRFDSFNFTRFNPLVGARPLSGMVDVVWSAACSALGAGDGTSRVQARRSPLPAGASPHQVEATTDRRQYGERAASRISRFSLLGYLLSGTDRVEHHRGPARDGVQRACGRLKRITGPLSLSFLIFFQGTSQRAQPGDPHSCPIANPAARSHLG